MQHLDGGVPQSPLGPCPRSSPCTGLIFTSQKVDIPPRQGPGIQGPGLWSSPPRSSIHLLHPSSPPRNWAHQLSGQPGLEGIRIRHPPFLWEVENGQARAESRPSLTATRTVVTMLHTIACASPFLMGLHGWTRHHQITAIHWTWTSGRTLAVLASLGDSPGAAALGCIAAVGPLPAPRSLGTHGRSFIAAHGHGKNTNCMISAGRVAADAVAWASDRRVEQILECPTCQGRRWTSMSHSPSPCPGQANSPSPPSQIHRTTSASQPGPLAFCSVASPSRRDSIASARRHPTRPQPEPSGLSPLTGRR